MNVNKTTRVEVEDLHKNNIMDWTWFTCLLSSELKRYIIFDCDHPTIDCGVDFLTWTFAMDWIILNGELQVMRLEDIEW